MTRKSLQALLVFTVFIGLLSSSGKAGFFYSKQKFYTIKTEHFFIHFPKELSSTAEEMRIISEEAFQNITSRLEWTPRGRTHVVMSDKTDVANGLATVMPYNYIMLYTTPPTADSSLDHYKDYLRLLFNHELTHIVHIDMHYRWASPFRYVLGKVVAPNGATPAWMREGMAVYEESRLDEDYGRNHSPYTDMLLRTSVYENKFPRIDQVAGLSAEFPAGVGPYLYGGRFFEWLANKYGEDRMYKYQKMYSSSLWAFSLNNKARRVYEKSFYKLWKEFELDIASEAQATKNQVEALGLTDFESILAGDKFYRGFTPRPGGGYAYFEGSLDESAGLYIKLPEEKEPRVIRRKLNGQMSFSKSGRYLAFASLSSVEPQTAKSEVYYYDIKEKKLFRVNDSRRGSNKAMRLKDPDFSSRDGGSRWLVSVQQNIDTDQLYVFDLFEKKGYVLTNEPEKTQLTAPRFSPDGKTIAVSRKDPKTGHRDVVLYSSTTGKRVASLTNDVSPDLSPVFSKSGDSLFFSSYRSGISNIYRYNFKTKSLSQVSNVLDGVFDPMVDPDSSGIYVQRYSSERRAIQRFIPSSTYSKVYLDQNKKKKVASTPFMKGRNFSFFKNEKGDLQVLEHKVSKDDLPKKFAALTSSEDDHDFSDNPQTALQQFARNPVEATDFLGGFSSSLSPDSFLKKSKVLEESESNKDVSKTENQPKDYPSSYKDVLSQKPYSLEVEPQLPADAKKYSAFPRILAPRYVMPSFLFFENAALIGLATGRSDALYRHSWTAFVNYRTDAKFVGGGGTYLFTKYKPVFYLGGLGYAVDWGTINNTRFFEERYQGYGGVSFNIKRHKFNLAYFYEHRSAANTLVGVNLLNMKPYAGLRWSYSLSNFDKYPRSISQENGYHIKLAGEWASSFLGSHDVNEERTIRADIRYYLEMPWSDHHVLAFRTAIGWKWGDVQQFGVYRLGGPFGEGVGTSYTSRLFPLRGLSGVTYAGDQVFIFSGEYRLPIANKVNWGIGTWPVFLDKAHLNLFVDGGDIRFIGSTSNLFDRLLVSAGAELKGDFMVGYGLPISVRTGYAVIFTNRSRLGSLTDGTTKQSLRYGSIYLQFGTMF